MSIGNPGGNYRLQLYEMIRKMTGRDMTEPEHQKLKSLLINYVKDHAPAYTPKPPDLPREYHIICGHCGGTKVFKGKKQRGQMANYQRKHLPYDQKIHGAPVPKVLTPDEQGKEDASNLI